MKVFCISQARMGSTRLPGKILKEINGIPLLKYHALRVAQAKKVDCHIIATTHLAQDKALVRFCLQHHIDYYCGGDNENGNEHCDENNVLARYYHAAKAFKAQASDLIIRVTSDCPLIAPELIDALIQQHIDQNIGGISNIDINSYPRGFDVEIFSMSLLEEAYLNAKDNFQLEHVTPYLYQHKTHAPQQSMKYPFDKEMPLSDVKFNPQSLRLCVDEIDDFRLIEALVKNFPNDIIGASAEEIIKFLHNHPEITEINQHVQQKSH